MRIELFASLSLCLSFAGSDAQAQASFQDKALASRLFDDAGRLLASGKVAEACPKYAESERIDPQLGTLLHLAECYAKLGKTASAWASFKEAAELAHHRSDPREPKIRERIAGFEGSLSNLVVDVSEQSPEVEVRQDGAVLGRAIWGAAVPVDPGTHTIQASAPGKKPWTQSVSISATATTTRVQVPLLESQPAAAPPPGAAVAQTRSAPASYSATELSAAAAAAASPAGPERPGISARSIGGWSMIGAGAASLGLGVVFALRHSSKLSERDAVCPSRVCPQMELAADRAQIAALTAEARSAATVSTLALAAGGVLAAGGIALLLTDHQQKTHAELSSFVSREGGGVTLKGGF